MNTRRSKLILFLSIVCALLASLLGSAVFVTPAHAAGITVNNDADVIADDGFCTLREAIANANSDSQPFSTSGECAAGSGTDTITFDPVFSGLTIYLGSPLIISSDMTIDGSALASQVTISGDSDNNGTGDVQVFSVGTGATVILDSLKITKGSALTGGGIYNNSGATLTITNSTLSGNSAQAAGGIHNLGLLTVTNSTFSDNHAVAAVGGDGGGIYNEGGLTVTNSTFSGNSASGSGGGIYNYNTMTVTNSTFSGNSAATSGGGIYNFNTLNYANTIIANSTSGGDCAGSGSIGTNVNNLVEDNTCSPSLSVDPLLDSLKDNGGPTQTMALILTSPAIDAGDDTTCANAPVSNLDQRGTTRPIGGHCDIGAFEGALDIIAPTVDSFTVPSSSTSLNVPITAFTASDNLAVTGYLVTESATPPAAGAAGWTASAPTSYTVAGGGSYMLYPWAKDAGDNVSTVYGSPASVTVCGSLSTITVTSNADSGAGTLRQAIADACSGVTIDFNASLSGETITLASQLDLLKNVTIDGSDLASKITISGGGSTRVFYVGSGVTAALDSLIVTQGSAGDGAGLLNDGTVTITNSLFSANSASNVGGAIRNNDTATLTVTDSTFSGGSAWNGAAIGNLNQLTITNSTFSGNTSGDVGGAIYNNSDIADHHNTLTITNSTFSGNSATYGGGIWSEQPMTVRNSTFSGNEGRGVGGTGAGIWQELDQLNYVNTIIANSLGGGGDCHAQSGVAPTSTNNLVEGGGNCASPLSVDPNLGPLADNGGATQTFALLANSPAIDAGDDATCAASPVSNLDQRGTARPNGGHCDIGAYEYVDTTAPSVTVFNVPASPTTLNIPITAFTVSDDAIVTGYLITESATPPTLVDPGWTATAPTTYPVASMGSYTLYPWAKDAAGHVSAVFASPATVNITCFNPITVTSNADSGPGTLRQALADACMGDLNNISIIDFDSALSGSTIHLASTLTIAKNVTIDGSDLASPITISGEDNLRVFNIPTIPAVSLTVTLDSLIVTKGATSGDGAGLFMGQGMHVTITNSTFSDNHAGGNGGGIGNQGGLTLIDSTVSGNSAAGTGGGGGIDNESGATITNSTISNNTATGLGAAGGGLANFGPATITNSTFFGNSISNGYGGGLSTTNSLKITNSTIVGNSAFIGGGIELQGNTTNLSNTIVAGNSSSFSGSNDDCSNDGATIATNTHNLIEDGTCSPFLSGDPGLAALADNGGRTQTMALLAGSSAIDAGDDTTCAATVDFPNYGAGGLDQRGIARPNSAHCDIGAYEYQDASAPTVTAFTVTSPAGLNIPITIFTASDDATVADYLITQTSTPPSTGAAGWTASAPTTYTVGSDGSYTLYPWAKDAVGNVSAVYGSPASVTVETSAPTVTSSTRVNTTPSNAASVDFIVTFSEAVSGVDTSDFSLATRAGLTGASITGVSGSGTAYTVSVNTGSGSGTLRLNLLDNDSITDSAGNRLGGRGLANGNFVSGEYYTIDKTAPTAGNLIAANVTTGGGTTYSFTVTFSDNLAIDRTSIDGSDIRVTGPGGFSQLATLVSVAPAGNGTPRTATYQITAPGGAWDSADRGTYTVAVEANQIFDSAGNPVGVASLGSFLVSLNYTVYLPLVR